MKNQEILVKSAEKTSHIYKYRFALKTTNNPIKTPTIMPISIQKAEGLPSSGSLTFIPYRPVINVIGKTVAEKIVKIFITRFVLCDVNDSLAL